MANVQSDSNSGELNLNDPDLWPIDSGSNAVENQSNDLPPFGEDLPPFGQELTPFGESVPTFDAGLLHPESPEIANLKTGEPSNTKAPRQEIASAQPRVLAPTVTHRPTEGRRRYRWLAGAPSWLISLTLHTAVLVALGAYQLEPIRDVIHSLTIESGPAEETTSLESYDVAVEEVSNSQLDSETELIPEAASAQAMSVSAPDVSIDASQIDVGGNVSGLAVGSLSSQLVPGNVLAAGSNPFTQGLMGRGMGSKRDLLEKYGGGADTEKAVAMGLKWLKEHQLPDGSWTFDLETACNGQCQHSGRYPDARNAATGLALMAFLGAGQTHLEGEYKEQVFKGLSYLLNSMRYDKFESVNLGSWYGDPAINANGRNPNTHNRIYGHGIDTIAVCEAYGMTKDPKLAEAAQLGINFIVAAQDPRGGGWGYELRTQGDTSIVGWQMMALKSAWMSNIPFPEETIRKASFFLDSVQTDSGSAYHYRNAGDRPGNMALTSCGLLCRMYMGMPKEHPALKEGVERLLKLGPNPDDAYVNYYATQVLKQYGGDPWKKWNEQMKGYLLSTQVNTGHAAGSWGPGNTYGDQTGGRLYRTTMSIMVLEVYYRYLPIYGEQKAEEAFKL